MPPAIGKLVSLEVLTLDGCALTSIPDEFVLMTRLMEVNLGNNELTKLPESIGRMTRLTVLNVMDNKLTDLPLSLYSQRSSVHLRFLNKFFFFRSGYCTGLKRIGNSINIARNPIQDTEILQKYAIGGDHLIDYLEKKLARKKNIFFLTYFLIFFS